MSNPVFIREDINNNKLNAIKAMPLKDSTSDKTSSFELNRKIYEKTYTTPITTSQINSLLKPARFGMGGNSGLGSSRIRPTIFDGTSAPNQKKWMGNRDASQVTVNRRTNSIGVGTLNYSNTPLSFTKPNDVNIVNHALRRVRSGGAVAPPSKNFSPSKTFVLSPGFHPYMQPGYKGKNPGYFPNLRYN